MKEDKYKQVKTEYYMEVIAKQLILPKYPGGKFFYVKNTLKGGYRSYEEYTGRMLFDGAKAAKLLIERSESRIDAEIQDDIETYMDLEECSEEAARAIAYERFLNAMIKKYGLSPRYEEVKV
jgi:hypothetical protein